jgi:hypothetical protein
MTELQSYPEVFGDTSTTLFHQVYPATSSDHQGQGVDPAYGADGKYPDKGRIRRVRGA